MNQSQRVLRAIVTLSLVVFWVQAAGAESRLYFPRISTSGINGLTIFNPGAGSNPSTAANDEITLSLYDTNGDLVAGEGITNPSKLEVLAGQNKAVLVTEVFGPVDPSIVGWIEGISENDGLTGFFLFLSPDQSLLDGADQPQVSRKIAFNDIRGSEEFRTEVNIFNTAGVTTQLDLVLLPPDQVLPPISVGAPPAEGFAPTFPAKGLLHIDDVAEFFDLPSIPEGSYLEVLSETPIGGFQFLHTSDGDLLGLNAKRRLEHLKVLYFPQLAVRGPWKMEANVVNYSLNPVTLLFSATQPDGQLYAPGNVAQNPVVRNLAPFTGLVEDVEELFGFSGAGPFEGALRVAAYRQGTAPLGGSGEPVAAINGSVRYGVVATGSEAAVAALPAAQDRVVFSHLATVAGFFTGFAAYNSSSAASNLRVMAFTEGGAELGLFDTVLGPGQRIADLITNIIPAAADQNGGYVWAKSSQPLHFSSLFGSSNATLLANVPPQPAPDGFLPDAGKPDFQIDPPFALVSLGGESSFETLGSSGGQTAWTINGEPGGNPALGEIDEAGAYDAPLTFPEPAGPLTLVAAKDELIAAATIDLLDEGSFNQEPIRGSLTQLAYLPGTDTLYGIVSGLSGAAPAGQIVSSLIEINEDSQTLILQLPGEGISELLPFESSTGKSLLLLLSWTTNQILRVDPNPPNAVTSEELVGGFDFPLAMAWNPVTGNLLVVDNNSLYSVSRVQLESDLVSGIPENGRQKVALIAVNAGQGVAVDACSGAVFWTNALGEVKSFDPVQGHLSTPVSGLGSPETVLALYRRDGGCPDALRLLIVERQPSRVSLVDPSDPIPLTYGQADSTEDLLFLPEGLGMRDTVLKAVRRATPGGNGEVGDVISIRAPFQHQSYATNVVGLGIPGSVADPLGDTYGIEAIQHDILDLSAYYDASDLHVTVAFADPISPCHDLCQQGQVPLNSLVGFLDLDLDRDSTTGALAFSDLNSPADTGLGVEACVNFEAYDEEAGDVPVLVLIGEFFEEVGRVAIDFGTYDLSFSIPLSLLGDDGPMNIAGVFGTAESVFGDQAGGTDVVPNIGFITSVPTEADGLQASPATRGSDSRTSGTRYRKTPAGGWIGLRQVTRDQD